MRVSTKLYAAVGALAAIGLLAAGTGIWYLRELGRELTAATGRTAVNLDLINATRARSWEMIASLRGSFILQYLKHGPEAEQNVQKGAAAFRRAHAQIAELRPLISTTEDSADLDRFASSLEEFGRTSEEYTRLSRQGNFEQVGALAPRILSFSNAADESLNRMKDRQRSLLRASQQRADSLKWWSVASSSTLGGFLVLIVVLVVIVVRGINRTLVMAVSELEAGAQQVTAAAGQVAQASQSLAQGSSEQAASLQQTSASAEEVNAMAQRSRGSAQAAADLAMQSKQEFARTDGSLDAMVAAIAEINTQSDRISRIIKVIDDVAFQTNILALNAAVEAARAGESGKGFAVVAEEVRNLAQRCGQAAKDTSALIEESIAKSKHGKTRVDEVATAVRSISTDSTRIQLLVEEVSQGSNQQATAMSQIGKAVVEMEQVTQSIAANAEEGASAAQELNAQSETLRDVVRQLSAMVGGGASQTGRRVR
ncbi:methyl-accepting chemotaxis protein [Paludibaculum fermentans]|uniref:methyl-accepting chemotaxis protein n=1 Tax=Paludibaculum fermentans TaxID=1473598 RepID=UPI003EBD2BE7